MKHRNFFTLAPFHAGEKPADIKITGIAEREADLFSISYQITGSLSAVELPGPHVPARRHALWEETCLEFFLAPVGSPRYWEFNLSPVGHWNAYSFDSYRKGMREEPSLEILPFACQTGPHTLRLSLEFDLAAIIPARLGIDAAVSAVIKMKDGGISYWALAHPATRPDFHDRACFKIAL